MLEKIEIKEKIKLSYIIAGGKGVILYEKIITQDTFAPSRKFFDRTEFLSALKQQNVSKEDYKISYYLWKTLKVRNLSDMNEPYNAHDVILLCEIVENRFQLMQDKYGFNPRKCNSAKFQLLYLEHLKIPIVRAGWKVTKIYSHYTFEKERLKKNLF